MFGKNEYHQISSSILGLNDTEVSQLHHYHHQLFSEGGYSAADISILAAEADGDPNQNSCIKKQSTTTKKDKHRKIYTSQGPRDRRVRLSISIARKFFDLQEMLGFDKPSKTLDWLLTKSKTAIKDLVMSKQNAAATTSGKNNDADEVSGSGSKRWKKVTKDSHLDLAKESRVKARARARERTREKMCIKQKLYEMRNNCCSSSSCHGGGFEFPPPIHYMNNQMEICKISGGCSRSSQDEGGGFHCLGDHYDEVNQTDLMHESIVIKRKVKSYGFQQNLIMNSNSGYASPPAAGTAENWDISSYTSQSDIYAILDQHKLSNNR